MINEKIYDISENYSDAEERENTVAYLLSIATVARKKYDAYWEKMSDYYNGKHDIRKQTAQYLGNIELPWIPCVIPDAFIQVECQRDPAIPEFEFSGRGANDHATAKLRESVVRYICDKNNIAGKNVFNEKYLNLYGSAVWKLAYSTQGQGGADIAIENPMPHNIFPDPYAKNIDDCEYIACVNKISKIKAMRIFANEIKSRGIDLDKTSDDTAEITEWWFRQPQGGEYSYEYDGESFTVNYDAGDIGLIILLDGKEIKYVPKFWQNTSCTKYPFVIYGKIANDDSLWGKSEIENIIPLIDAADRQIAFAQLNCAFSAADITVFEESAFADGEYPSVAPGAMWKTRPGMIDKVKRIGNLSSTNEKHFEIVDKYRSLIKETTGMYDYLQGSETSAVTTATGIALLNERAASRVKSKRADKIAGFARLFELCDYMALEHYDTEKIKELGFENAEIFDAEAQSEYIPPVDVKINMASELEISRSFTVSALSDLINADINEENYPIVRAFIDMLDVPIKSKIYEKLDEKYHVTEE